MSDWRSLAVRFDAAARAETPEAALEYLARCYRAVFVTGGSSDEQRQVVLADLADHCEFYKVCERPELLAEHNGKRKAFDRIFQFMSFGEFEFAALERAARREDGASRAAKQRK